MIVNKEKKAYYPNNITIAGDGTPIVTSARERKHCICDCKYKGIDESDLPAFPLLGPASRHDSHSFSYIWFTMKELVPDFITDFIKNQISKP